MAANTSQATLLANAVGKDARVELFHDPDEVAWVRVEVKPDTFEHWPVESDRFRRWMVLLSYEELEVVPGGDSVRAAGRALAASALHDGEMHPVHLRVANLGETTFVDLVDADRTIIEVTAKGWRPRAGEPPVRFTRSHGMRPLPMPKATKEPPTKLLSPFLNVDRSGLILSATLTANRLSGIGPFPILGVHGEHGTGKSVGTRVQRDLTDPNKADVRSLPTEERDLIIAALNSYVLTFGNVSELPQWLSDALCRLATGAGFSKRALYTDSDEVIMAALRPIIIEGIPEVEVAPDLADRTVTITLEPIRAGEYIAEKAFWPRFESAHPELLGAHLNAVADGLGRLESVSVKSEFRMADFARFAEAVAPSVGKGFLRAYKEQRQESAAAALDSCVFHDQLRDALALNGPIAEEPSKLLSLLESRLPDGLPKPKDWPKRANELGEQLRRIAPALRTEGIGISHGKSNGRRVWKVWFLTSEEMSQSQGRQGTTGTTRDDRSEDEEEENRDDRDDRL